MDEFIRIITRLEKRIEELERQVTIKNLTFPSDGKLVVPASSGDPASGTEGQINFNTSTHLLKVYKSGTWVAVNTA